jgi:hypothetical protein
MFHHARPDLELGVFGFALLDASRIPGFVEMGLDFLSLFVYSSIRLAEDRFWRRGGFLPPLLPLVLLASAFRADGAKNIRIRR